MIPTQDDIVKRLSLKGPLAGLPWVKVSRSDPSSPAAADSDVVYRLRSNDEIATGHPRRP